jgi:hypothetical protein
MNITSTSVTSTPSQQTLRSEATANEQRSRDRAAQDNGILAEPAKSVVRSDLAAAQAYSQSRPASNNAASGYQQAANDQAKQQLEAKVKVDISV